MTALAAFQNAFVRALTDAQGVSPSMAALAAQPGFAVYRNTGAKGCIDALQAAYPTLVRIVGEQWLRAAAAAYARAHPPTTPVLLDYGAGFPDFLRAFAPAAEMPYLAEVARVDRLWNEAHVARDAAPLARAALTALAPAGLAARRLCPHPAARWAWFDAPIETLWRRNREEETPDFSALEWQGEGVLVTRPEFETRVRAIPRAGCIVLDRCADACVLAEALSAALTAEPAADLGRILAELIEAGAFMSPAPDPPEETPP